MRTYKLILQMKAHFAWTLQKTWAQLFKTNDVVSLRFVKISNVNI